MGAFNTGFDSDNLHHPTMGSAHLALRVKSSESYESCVQGRAHDARHVIR